MTKFTVLAVDDDPVDLMAVQRALRGASDRFNLITATTVSEALLLTRSEQPDAIVSDHNLGNDTSLQLLHDLRRRNILTPVIVLTGQGDEQVAVQVLTAGAADYLRKDQLDATRLDHTLTRVITTAQQTLYAERARQALQTLATGTAHHTGADFFPALVRHLASALNAQACWVMIQDGDAANVLAGWRHPGDDLSGSSYPLSGSPCVDALMQESVHRSADVLLSMTSSSGIATLAGWYHGIALRDSFGRPFGTLVVIADQAEHDLVDSLLRICGERACSEWNRLRIQQDQQAEYARQRAIAACCQELFWNRQPKRTLENCLRLISQEFQQMPLQLWRLEGGTAQVVCHHAAPPTLSPQSPQMDQDLLRSMQQGSPHRNAQGWHIPIQCNASLVGWLSCLQQQLALRDQNALAQIGDLLGAFISRN